MTQAQTASLPGSMISDRYQIIESLRQGDMAHVYLAVDLKNGKNVAVKVMHDYLSNDPVFIKHFEIEARATSRLHHPNIVRVISFGQDFERRYIVQEYVEGYSLKELININGAIPWQTAVPMAIQIGLALEHIHENGLVHRDIKPHNILITKERLAKVTDFGITKAMTSSMITLTREIIFGSIHYSSPEQARGTFMGERSDIYSLGILIYEMVTGRVPFDGNTPVAIAIKHLQEFPPLPSLINSMVPRGLDQIIMKCIQKSPDNRYQDARELINELDAFLINPNGVYGIVAGLPDRDEQTTALQAMSTEPKYNMLREIEQIIIKRRHSRQRSTAIVMAIILASIVFVTSIGAWGWQKLSDSIQTEPNQYYELSYYIGRELPEVLETLERDNILFEIIYVENPTVIAEVITAQTPSSGVMIEKSNGTLILTVSSGPDLQVIPNLRGQSSTKAQTMLTQTLGYKVTIVTEIAQFDQGRVIRTFPAAGMRATRGSSITLFVSSGLPLLIMPNFVGESLTNVRSQIVALGLVLGPTVSISGTVKESKRIVISQSVPAGSEIMQQSIISLAYGTAQDYANLRSSVSNDRTPTSKPASQPRTTTTEPLPTTTTATPTTEPMSTTTTAAPTTEPLPTTTTAAPTTVPMPTTTTAAPTEPMPTAVPTTEPLPTTAPTTEPLPTTAPTEPLPTTIPTTEPTEPTTTITSPTST